MLVPPLRSSESASSSVSVYLPLCVCMCVCEHTHMYVYTCAGSSQESICVSLHPSVPWFIDLSVHIHQLLTSVSPLLGREGA
jgi:hypothetical protein